MADAATLAARFKDFPAIDILSRRMVDPSDIGSLPILLKDEDANACVDSGHQYKLRDSDTTCRFCHKPVRQWYVRYFNLAKEGRNAEMRAKGYIAVQLNELKDADDVADLFRSDKDQFVRRGDRGQEILGKQPLLYHLEIKRRHKAQMDVHMGSAKARREDRAEAAGEALGDEAGQRIFNGAIKEEYFRRPKTTLGDEADAVENDD